jgi:hypothetical protein
MAGRKPLGPELVQHLEGSEHAKEKCTSSFRRWCTRSMLLASSFVAIGLFCLFCAPVNTHTLCAWLRGDGFSLEQPLLDLGPGRVGDDREINVAVHNLSADPIRLIGASSSCGCQVQTRLPLTIPPRSKGVVRLKAAYPSRKGRFERAYSLYIDRFASLEEIPAKIAGRVVMSR